MIKRKNSTVVMITHKLELIKSFDLIIVIDNGLIVGEGGHDDLLLSNTIYQNMVAAVNAS